MPTPTPQAAGGSTERRGVALVFQPDELLEALRAAGYVIPAEASFRGIVDDHERGQVRLLLRGPAYPVVAEMCEPPRFPAASVRSGLRVIAEHAAAAVDMVLVPRPVPRPAGSLEPGTAATLRDDDRTAEASAQLGDGGLGVGMAVST